ncbi:MAG TPA: hypothetical protein VK173_01235 [Lacibacter sp.]|nr:hypothetical protein [Lacibacter sp.]
MIEEESKNNFCFYAGLFGVLISVATLFQMFIYGSGNWMAFSVILCVVFSITAFSFLIAKSRFTLPLLLSNTILFLLINIFFLITLSFSLLIVILFLYSSIILSIFWAGGTPAYLKQLHKYKKQEELEWQNKLQ